MTLEDITRYIDSKIEQNAKKIIVSFYEIRIKFNLKEEEAFALLILIETRLKNLGYSTYKTGETYAVDGIENIVKNNELLVGIKSNDENKGMN
jgi:hypothetical protein